MAKTAAEKIAEAQEKIAQYENQVKKIKQQQKETDRKARTKRLIERGAILESLIPGADALTNDQIKAFLEKTIQSDYARRALANLKAEQEKQTADNGTTAPAQDGEKSADAPAKPTTPNNPTPADKPAGAAWNGGTGGGANPQNEARQGG